MKQTIGSAKEAVRQYAMEHYPNALAVILGGSWARGKAHEGSDLDIMVIDQTIERVAFEGVHHGDWIVDICILNPNHVKTFFDESAQYRSAPIPHQVIDSILIAGDVSLYEQIRAQAISTISQGPCPISDAMQYDQRYYLTLLSDDLVHSSAEALPALAAYAHVELSKAYIDVKRHWRAERKSLHRVLVECNQVFANQLDNALIEAIHGKPSQMAIICDEVIALLGGPLKTYNRSTA